MDQPHKFRLNLTKILDLRSSNKHVALQTIFYTEKNMGKKYRNNKLKKIALTLNDEFHLSDGSYSVEDI